MYYNTNYIEWGSTSGWRCPGCGRSYAPNQPMCFYCGGDQRTWTSPTTTGMPPNWDDYLKQTTVGDHFWWKDYVTKSAADSAAAGIKQEVATGTGQASVSANKNVTITAYNDTITCGINCNNCDKYEKSCFGGIETTSSKAIISHRKQPKVTYDLIEEDILDSFMKHFKD